MQDNGLSAWQANAKFWDEQMGEHSNFFHRDIVRPHVLQLLQPKADDLILDIACGNGNFSAYLAEIGAQVLAFDFSSKMIELARQRRQKYLDKIDFRVCDATDYQALLKLKQKKPFNKAVANMAIMDIANIKPLFRAVYELLAEDGIFVFATHHPCFTYEGDDYFTPAVNKGVAIEGQPQLHNYYHRSLSEILNDAFAVGFKLDGFLENSFLQEKVPIIVTIRLVK